MSKVLWLDQYRKPTQNTWEVEDWYVDGQMIGYRVVKFNRNLQKQEVLESFFVDPNDNDQRQYAHAWNRAQTVKNKANAIIRGWDEY